MAIPAFGIGWVIRMSFFIFALISRPLSIFLFRVAIPLSVCYRRISLFSLSYPLMLFLDIAVGTPRC